MARKLSLLIISFIAICLYSNAGPEHVIIHSTGGHGGHDQSSYPPPEASYDDETATLTVYFNMAGTLTLTCTDDTGTTSTIVYQQPYSTGSTATVTCTTPGYYEITVNCSYAGTYTGHFTVS